MKPLVSIIMPIYNMAAYLEECLDSILNQSLKELEIICINDASKDTSLAILEAYRNRDSRIQIINLQENKGSGIARNIGIEKAQGNFLAFCDADDTYPQNALEILLLCAETSRSLVAAGNIAIMDALLKYLVPLNAANACMQFFETIITSPFEYPPLWIPCYHPRFLIAASLLHDKNIRYPNLLRGQDPPFLAKVFCNVERIAITPQIIYHYRTGHGEFRLSSMQKATDYCKHIELTHNIFIQSGAIKQAMLYMAFQSANILSFSCLKQLQPDIRSYIINTIIEIINNSPNIFNEKYEPYFVDMAHLKMTCQRLKKGYWYYLITKIYDKIVPLISK